MTDGLRWVAEAYPFGYSLIFCEGLTPEEVLRRLGAPRESVFPLTRHEAQEIEVRNSMGEPFDLDHLEDLDVEAVEDEHVHSGVEPARRRRRRAAETGPGLLSACPDRVSSSGYPRRSKPAVASVAVVMSPITVARDRARV
jgi:hypothetical protein